MGPLALFTNVAASLLLQQITTWLAAICSIADHGSSPILGAGAVWIAWSPSGPIAQNAIPGAPLLVARLLFGARPGAVLPFAL